MKGTLFALALAVAWALPATAADPGPADLEAAGYAGVAAVAPAGGRFAAPVRYFRSSDRLGEAEAKKDCADCGDLIAVYSTTFPSNPNWALNAPMRKVGARWQVRGWFNETKRVLIVTGPDRDKTQKLFDTLAKKP